MSVAVGGEWGDGSIVRWTYELSLTQPVAVAAWQVAWEAGEPADEVGLEDEEGYAVELQMTPTDLGWIRGQEIQLSAYFCDGPCIVEEACGSVPIAGWPFEEPMLVAPRHPVARGSIGLPVLLEEGGGIFLGVHDALLGKARGVLRGWAPG